MTDKSSDPIRSFSIQKQPPSVRWVCDYERFARFTRYTHLDSLLILFCKMNYFKLILALLAGASFVSAAANPRADANGVCELNAADDQRLEQIVQEDENPAELAEMINGCMALVYNAALETGLYEMVRLRRLALFRYVFPLVDFGNRGRRGGQRNTGLYELLQYAVRHNSVGIADYLLGRGLQISHMVGGGLWQRAENLEVIGPLLAIHPEQAEHLSPTQLDMAAVENEAHARVLVAATRLCDGLRGQHTFNANEWLRELAFSGVFMEDHDLAAVATYLIREAGAEMNEEIRGYYVERRPAALRLIDEWLEWEEEVKTPESD